MLFGNFLRMRKQRFFSARSLVKDHFDLGDNVNETSATNVIYSLNSKTYTTRRQSPLRVHQTLLAHIKP